MEIPLPNGGVLLTRDDAGGPQIVFTMHGMSFGAYILEPNDEVFQSEAWVNRQIELYEIAKQKAEEEFE